VEEAGATKVGVVHPQARRQGQDPRMEVEGHHLHWCMNKEIFVLSLANQRNLIDAFSFSREKKAEILSIGEVCSTPFLFAPLCWETDLLDSNQFVICCQCNLIIIALSHSLELDL